jgi:hypothetical protein
MQRLPTNNPLYDVQCTACVFRAQVKTNRSRPKSEIFGAGWDIMKRVLRAGFLVPPLIVNFKWRDRRTIHQEIRFYPFVPHSNLRNYTTDIKRDRKRYAMFNYVGMDKLPFLRWTKRGWRDGSSRADLASPQA